MTDREKMEALELVMKRLENTIKDIETTGKGWVAWDKVLTAIEQIVND